MPIKTNRKKKKKATPKKTNSKTTTTKRKRKIPIVIVDDKPTKRKKTTTIKKKTTTRKKKTTTTTKKKKTKTTKKKKTIKGEAALQRKCVQWFRDNYKPYIICSTGYNAKHDKCHHKGMTDLIIFKRSGSYGAYGIEMKNPNGKGRKSKEQIACHRQLRNDGYKVSVIDQFDDFKRKVKKYMTKKPSNNHISKIKRQTTLDQCYETVITLE